MAEKKYKFTTPQQAARIVGQMIGTTNKTADELHRLMDHQRPWTAGDSANLARIADALECMAKRFGAK